MDKIDRLVAESDIRNNYYLYARCVDRRDWARLPDVFHPDCIDEHGGDRHTPEHFVAWVSGRHKTIPFAAHLISNCLIEFLDDNTAAVEAYFHTIRREPTADAPGKETDVEIFGRYVDRFERRADGAWKVAARKVLLDSWRVAPSSVHLRDMHGIMGRRDQDDPVFATRR